MRLINTLLVRNNFKFILDMQKYDLKRLTKKILSCHYKKALYISLKQSSGFVECDYFLVADKYFLILLF